MKLLDKTVWKFALVGVINTVFGTAIMFVFYNVFHIDYLHSTLSNYVLGSILSYFLNKYFTFQNKDNSFWGVIRFIINIVVCYSVAYGLAKPLMMWLLSDQSKSLQENGAMLIGMGLFVGLNYFGQRFFVFRARSHADSAETE